MKIARVKYGGSDDTQKDNATVELPWAGHDRDAGWMRFSFDGFTLRSLSGRTRRSRGCIRRGSDFVFFDWSHDLPGV